MSKFWWSLIRKWDPIGPLFMSLEINFPSFGWNFCIRIPLFIGVMILFDTMSMVFLDLIP